MISLSSPDVLGAVIAFACAALAEPFLECRIYRCATKSQGAQWSWDNFVAPLLRAAMVVGFVYIAYPGLFGLRDAPYVSTLLAGENSHTSALLGVVFLAGLIASLLPVFGRYPQFILPLQGCLASAYLFTCLTAYLGITTAQMWPGVDIAALIILTSFVGHRLGTAMGRTIGAWADRRFHTEGYDVAVTHVFDLLAQIPVILLFANGLGRQLAI